MEIDIHFRYN